MAKQYGRIHRLLRLLTLIQSGRWNAEQLAHECGTTVRTIYRDLKMLEGAGVPYYFDAERGAYCIRGDFFMPPVELNIEESLALIAAANQIGGREQIPFLGPLERVAQKILTHLPGALREQAEMVRPHIEIDLARSGPGEEIRDVYQAVRAAIRKRRALSCSYESTRSGTARHDAGQPFIFEPYCLFWGQRAWYAVGHHDGRQEIRILKLNRFTRVEQTDRPYAIPDDFSMRQFLGKAWRMIRGNRIYRVELHFDKQFAETVADTHWHDTQQMEWHEDGSILFRCEVAGLDEIVWWILSMGPHCRVLKPALLARRVADLAEATARQYSPALRGAPQSAPRRTGVSATLT